MKGTKNSVLIIFLIILSFSAHSQILKKAKWSYGTSKKEVKVGEELDLIFYADIDRDWYLYSSDFDPELGPILTTFSFTPHSSYQLVGDIKPIGAKKKYDEIWEGEYTYFVGRAEFRQTIKVLSPGLKVKGSYEYQVCSDIDGQCINYEDDFIFDNIKVTTGTAEPTLGKETKTLLDQQVSDETKEKIETTSSDTILSSSSAVVDTAKVTDKSINNTTVLDAQPKKGLLAQKDPTSPYAVWSFMLVAFLGGLAALLTPCVFPMIPLTVSFFTNNSGSRRSAIFKAIFYGFSIVFIYTIIGSAITLFFGAEVLNDLATNRWANIIFFLVFFIFALSFFGLFEITLPSSFVNKMDKQSDKGGYYGIFFMALTLVLVSFSCTGPIAGSLLVESAGGIKILPALGMFAFSMAFAIPFTLFAIFPEWLNSLPKSGGWLNSVKVVLGFLELALGLKFLSVADQVYHWGLLDREVYLALWIVIFSLMGFYLLGKIKLPNDSETKHVSVPRLMLAIVTFAFVLYLIPGMWGAPLKALAGYLPPMSTHDFNIKSLLAETGTTTDETKSICGAPKYSDFLHFPHGIKGYFDLTQARECAKQLNKPLFIDFTGHGCVNCREMEARVWSDPEVLKRLKNDYVVVALYVDERTELPETDWYTSSFDGRVKKTIGKQNADFQITEFGNNAQPYYVLLGPDDKTPLVQPVAYNRSVADFIEFLDKGLEAYRQKEGDEGNSEILSIK